MTSRYRNTTFGIKNDDDYLNMTIASRKSGKSFIDFAWDAVLEKTKKVLLTTDSLCKWQGVKPELTPPSDPYDLEAWSTYLKAVDKSQWKKFDQLINKLARLSDTKRSELRRKGDL